MVLPHSIKHSVDFRLHAIFDMSLHPKYPSLSRAQPHCAVTHDMETAEIEYLKRFSKTNVVRTEL